MRSITAAAVVAACLLSACASAPPASPAHHIDLTAEQAAKCESVGCLVFHRDKLDELLTNVLEQGVELGKAIEKQAAKERT
jgi:hypothetical protein